EKLSVLVKLVEERKLTLRVADVFRPEEASIAHNRLEAGGTRGRLIIKF
ncbi:MAG: zinc-binding dehydrogenase, partial [Pseudomonadota bacterium]|nr:zinc-binding dehydrogenase [Pseudomonadota bacterium]